MPTSAFQSHSLQPLSWWSTTCGGRRRRPMKRATATLRFSSSNKEFGCDGNRFNAAVCHPAHPRSTVRQHDQQAAAYPTYTTPCVVPIVAIVLTLLDAFESRLMTYIASVLVLPCSFPLHWQWRLQEEFSRLVSGPVWRLSRGGGGVRAAR